MDITSTIPIVATTPIVATDHKDVTFEDNEVLSEVYTVSTRFGCLICKKCKKAVSPNESYAHVHGQAHETFSSNSGRTSGAKLVDQCVKMQNEAKNNLKDSIDYDKVHTPDAYLTIFDGYQCPAVGGCSYTCQRKNTMRSHIRNNHTETSTNCELMKKCLLQDIGNNNRIRVHPPQNPSHAVVDIHAAIHSEEAAMIVPDNDHSKRDQSMWVILPQNGFENLEVARLLKYLDKVLQMPATKTYFAKSDERENGVRQIQANRYEIFVKIQNTAKKTEGFSWICNKIIGECRSNKETLYNNEPQLMKDAIVGYATQQAKLDTRMRDDVQFDNFSLITSYGKVNAQRPHVDLLYPNFQLGLLVTDHSPTTLVYKSFVPISSVKELSEVWRDLPESVRNVMDNHLDFKVLLRDYGIVLFPLVRSADITIINGGNKEGGSVHSSLSRSQPTRATPELYRTGTVTSLPGSEVHAGPATSQNRTVLFFSACPQTAEPYNPDVQYFAPLLLCQLMEYLWGLIDQEGKEYLIEKLACQLEDTDCGSLAINFPSVSLENFIKEIMKLRVAYKAKRKRLFDKMSESLFSE